MWGKEKSVYVKYTAHFSGKTIKSVVHEKKEKYNTAAWGSIKIN